ncbi:MULTISPECIES: hypothetical protein [Micrococcales]|uniref:hypothetical protein n=1 Tax=Micrococcales TaxID=85006 RepID=UPI00128ED3FD|nr:MULTISPECIES: hypothetical protein [Micrococcales]
MSISFLIASEQIPHILGLPKTVTPRDALGDLTIVSRRAFAKVVLASLVNGNQDAWHRCLTDPRGHGTRRLLPPVCHIFPECADLVQHREKSPGDLPQQPTENDRGYEDEDRP